MYAPQQIVAVVVVVVESSSPGVFIALSNE